MSYIVFDMDDTLLNDRRQVTPYTLNILRQLQSMGHSLVVNTARSKLFNQEYFDLIQPNYAILNGGALIIDQDERVIFRAEIDTATIQAVICDLLKLTKNFSVQTEEVLYSHLGSYTGQSAKPFDFEKNAFSMPALKIVAAIENAVEAEAIAQRYHLQYTTYLGGVFRRYNHIGATKALGNQNLMHIVGAQTDQIIAFGDDLGDMQMLQQAGIGVLMKNAKLPLHAQCKYISQYSNDEDGVARFLVEYFHMDMKKPL